MGSREEIITKGKKCAKESFITNIFLFMIQAAAGDIFRSLEEI
jgi:hypothetical protein